LGVVWKKHLAVSVTNNESPIWADVDGDGQPELVFGYSPDQNPDSAQRRVALARPGKDPHAPWPVRTISAVGAPGSMKYAHGLGVGDVNSDKRPDVLTQQGWYENPGPQTRTEWTFHPANFGEACAHMLVCDADGDGLADVITSSAHRYGIWWHQQTAAGWRTRLIDRSCSQTHALVLADINGDGLPDFVTGKRWWAHVHGDPGRDEPAMVLWFELRRIGGMPQWTRHEIDNDSGVGTQFEVSDVNGDGLLDVVVSNKKGVYYFQQVRTR